MWYAAKPTVFIRWNTEFLIVDSQNYQRSDRQFTIDSTKVNSDDDDDDDEDDDDDDNTLFG